MEQEIAINLQLNVNEVNTILRCLGKHPFDEVVQLVTKIKMQGDEQLSKMESESKAAAVAA